MATNSNKRTWPPTQLNTPTVPHQDATLSTVASIEISAPAELVFSLLVDASTYPFWCTWVPRVTINSQPDGTPSDAVSFQTGTHFTYHVIMDAAKPSKETATHLRVTDISTPKNPSSYIPSETLQSDPSYTEDLSRVYRVAWSGDGGLFAKGLRSDRLHEVIMVDENSCEVRTWENMGGILARTVRWLYKDTLAKKFDEWCRDLKKASEEKFVAQKD